MFARMEYMQFLKRLLLVGYLSLLAAPFAATIAATPTANSAYQLTTSPVSANLEAKPGTTVTTDLRNDAEANQKIHISLMKFAAQGEEGKPILSDRGPDDSYFDWVSFSQNDFWLASNQWATIKMTINVPASASNGYYYAVKFSRVGDNVSVPGKGTYVGSNSILVLLDARSGTAKRDLSILNFTATQKIYEALPAELLTRLRNSGNVHIRPAGSIFIMQGKKQLAVMDFNAAGGNVLPASNRIFKNQWSDGFPHYEQKKDETGAGVVDKYSKPVNHLVWNFSQLGNIRIGQYTAKLVAVYQDNDGRDIPLEAEVSFWVIPWRFIGVVLLILIFVPIGMYATGRTIWKKTKHKQY
jgi:hypothetical protein